MSGCKFAEGWKNREGWLMMSNGKLVCLDWDEYCVECRVDDRKDYIFTVSTKQREIDEANRVADESVGVLPSETKMVKMKFKVIDEES